MGVILIKPFYFLSILLFLFCRQNIIFAEIYKYIDENNIVIYTDNISLVPEDQRESAFQFKGTSLYEPDIVKHESTALNSENIIRPIIPNDKEQRQTDFEKEKSELAEELNKLMLEKKNLLRKKLTYKTKRQDTEFKENILNLVKKINTFNEKQKELNKRIDAFNKEPKTESMVKKKINQVFP